MKIRDFVSYWSETKSVRFFLILTGSILFVGGAVFVELAVKRFAVES